MKKIVFVAPYLAPATRRFLEAMVSQEGVHCGLLTQQSVDHIARPLRQRLAAHWQVPDALDPDALEQGVRGLAVQLGGVDGLTGILEHLQVPLAIVRERLGVVGLGAEAARNFRDKARMKTVLKQAGIPCARHELAGSRGHAESAARDIGFPMVVKPPAGAGALSTFRIENEHMLHDALHHMAPTPENPILMEEFLAGDEFSLDSIVIDGQMVWHSCSSYSPTPLTVIENPWIQWCVLLPRSIDGPLFSAAQEIGARAVRALGLQTGISHLEWFRRRDGSIAVSEVGARPPGAQFMSLMSWAHDIDLYAAWARLMSQGVFTPPARKYAVGGAYFRGQGRGRVVRVHGLDEAQRELGDLVVEASIPSAGQPRVSGYEGDGFAILRHPDTEVVERGLRRLVELVRVETEEE